MGVLHIANTDFEWELKTGNTYPLEEGLYRHPYFLQLQYLPLLYANEEDGVLLTHRPPKTYLNYLKKRGFLLPKIHLFHDTHFPYESVESWGWSNNVKTWATEHRLIYNPPPMHYVKMLTSKVFSFTHSPHLIEAELLHNLDEVKCWLSQGHFPKVIKACFGVAGKEHFLFDHKEDLIYVKERLSKACQTGHPLIGEPWVKRLLDFSTQWLLTKEKRAIYLGTTIMKNTKTGQYQQTLVDQEHSLLGEFHPFLKQHLECAEHLIECIQDKNYVGYLGIDAMIYQHPKNQHTMLHPIVEINPRQTIGLLALNIYQKRACKRLFLSYIPSKTSGLLPLSVTCKEKTITFPKQLKLVMMK